MQLLPWIRALRLRTLPLALSCVVMGTFMAVNAGHFNVLTCFLLTTTIVLLQVLSNLANDLGDFEHGLDDKERKGPQRALQSGAITKKQMKRAIVTTVILTFISGITLLISQFDSVADYSFVLLFLVGIGAIIAAIKYTYGKKPYGYAGLGDLFVFIFFGMVGVTGTNFLYTGQWNGLVMIPASALGLMAVGVLNLNNLRDIENDAQKGKRTLVVRMGLKKAKLYHAILLSTSFLLALGYNMVNQAPWISYLFILILPIVVRHVRIVLYCQKTKTFNLELRNLALLTFVFATLFGLGQLFEKWI